MEKRNVIKETEIWIQKDHNDLSNKNDIVRVEDDFERVTSSF
jgi:hypothetical protein